MEAIVDALKKIETDKVNLEVIHSDVGAITENDVALASASQGIILGFHTRVDSTAAQKAKHANVQIKLYAIIYEFDRRGEVRHDRFARSCGEGSHRRLGEVRQVFELSKACRSQVRWSPLDGSYAAKSAPPQGCHLRRRHAVAAPFPDEVNEVRSGMECGIRIEGFSEVEVGDVIECYTIEKVAQKL